ncbi:hypothetical protein CL689_04900 [Candidatus Saccharibacteria bacterium]|nr:hypothetical protein [Candidatus Saccharibacteria bacterium]
MNSLQVRSSFKSRARQAGVSLIELSIALAIIAVITITGIVFATDALKESRIGSEAARVNSIVMKSRAAFQNRALANLSVAATTTLDAARLGVFPADMLDKPITDTSLAATDVKNRWGGNVQIFSNPGLSVMTLVYNDIPQSDCIEFVNRVSSLFSYVSSGATVATTGATAIKTPTVALSTANTQTACQAGDNILTFAFSK